MRQKFTKLKNHRPTVHLINLKNQRFFRHLIEKTSKVEIILTKLQKNVNE